MVNKVLTTTILATLVSSTLAAVNYTPPKVWECDSPGTEGYYFSDEEVPYENASAACQQTGGIFADANNHNFLFLSDLVRNCVGENENAWVRSWDFNPTNPEERRCLALFVGHSGAGGGINPACNVNRYALCMTGGKRTHSNPNVINYGNGGGDLGRTVTVTETVTLQYNNAPQGQYSSYYVNYGSSTQVFTQEQPIPTTTYSSTSEAEPTMFNFSFLAEAPTETESVSTEA